MAIAYYDGAFVDKDTIKVSLDDYGFSRGLAFFETMRVYGGAPFHLDEHYKRLEEGIAILGLSMPLTAAEVSQTVRHVCTGNKFQHSVIKFYLTAGESHTHPYQLAKDHKFAPHFFVVEDEMKPDHPEAPYGLDFYKRGLRLKIVPHERALPKAKSVNYLQAYNAAREAGETWDDILFTHRDGYITESSRANFFCVIEGVLCTPGKNTLDGVTRKVVLEIARELNIPVDERTLRPEDLKKATEAFVSGSYAELVPAKQIDEHVMAVTMDAPIFRQLRKTYSAKIEESCRVYAAIPNP